MMGNTVFRTESKGGDTSLLGPVYTDGSAQKILSVKGGRFLASLRIPKFYKAHPFEVSRFLVVYPADSSHLCPYIIEKLLDTIIVYIVRQVSDEELITPVGFGAEFFRLSLRRGGTSVVTLTATHHTLRWGPDVSRSRRGRHHLHGPSIQFAPRGRYGTGSAGTVGHLDESATVKLSRLPVREPFDVCHGAGAQVRSEGRLVHAKGEVPHEETSTHTRDPRRRRRTRRREFGSFGLVRCGLEPFHLALDSIRVLWSALLLLLLLLLPLCPVLLTSTRLSAELREDRGSIRSKF
mmetsp:Transcript_7604/g.15813  ORF Transcript_7604/g.15813 Transcript_7604/m.15813 type:complete len:293 (-) Transcript_7604:326-1204(-)